MESIPLELRSVLRTVLQPRVYLPLFITSCSLLLMLSVLFFCTDRNNRGTNHHHRKIHLEMEGTEDQRRSLGVHTDFFVGAIGSSSRWRRREGAAVRRAAARKRRRKWAARQGLAPEAFIQTCLMGHNQYRTYYPTHTTSPPQRPKPIQPINIFGPKLPLNGLKPWFPAQPTHNQQRAPLGLPFATQHSCEPRLITFQKHRFYSAIQVNA